MKFCELILEKLYSLFTRHGLRVMEQTEHTIRFESAFVHISLVHDPRENSNNLWVGRNQLDAVEIDNQVMQEHFHSKLKLDNLIQEVFINNVVAFFANEGLELLRGNALFDLEKYNARKGLEYTKNLIDMQNIEQANLAWSNGSYFDVVKFLEKTDRVALPKALKQKYELAKKRLGN